MVSPKEAKQTKRQQPSSPHAQQQQQRKVGGRSVTVTHKQRHHHHHHHHHHHSSTNDTPSSSGGMQSILPSFIGVTVLIFAIMAQRGFRGRPQIVGIDLGTTNSVVCIQQQQALSSSSNNKSTIRRNDIVCIPDDNNNNKSPIIPSVISFLTTTTTTTTGPSSSSKLPIPPDPYSTVLVGQRAKQRIGSHPHHTLYNAKRVLGRPYHDKAVQQLQQEVEFDIVIVESKSTTADSSSSTTTDNNNNEVQFRIPITTTTTATTMDGGGNSRTSSNNNSNNNNIITITPQQVGSYIVHYLMTLTREYLGHNNVNSAVIAVPANFNNIQRQRTIEAFTNVGISVVRILEEPTAAAIAYGLDKKSNVNNILVYDFGGGTLDVSILYVNVDGYVDVIGSDGDDNLGGVDFDIAIAHYLRDQHPTILKVVSQYDDSDVIEQLADTCVDDGDGAAATDDDDQRISVTDEIPICSLSSFHTLGERLKISLSEQVLNLENTTTGRNDVDDPTTATVVATASCWAIPPLVPSQLQQNHRPTKKEDLSLFIKDVCHQLQLQQISISLKDYNEAVKDLLERSLVPVQRLMNDLQLEPNDIDEIVMVGGTTRMPQIRNLVSNAFSDAQLNTHIDPDLTVAYGAASVID